MGIACGGGGAGVAEQALDMTQTEALFEQVRGEAVAQRVDRDFFLIPHCCTTAFMAACAPPRSIDVVALRMRSGEPPALANNKRGCSCASSRTLAHSVKNLLEFEKASGV